jgi:hypothetical protein
MKVIILLIGEKRKPLKHYVADFSTLPFYIERNSKTRNYIRVKYLDVLSKVNLLFRLMLLLKICLNQRQSMLSLLLC